MVETHPGNIYLSYAGINDETVYVVVVDPVLFRSYRRGMTDPATEIPGTKKMTPQEYLDSSFS